MTDYTKLIEALRCCTSSSPDDCDICAYQPFCKRNGTGRERIMIDATAAIEALQAQLPKRGEWISDRLVTTNGGTYGVRRCSICEAYYQDIGYGWNYCPNCGAKMEVQDG